MLHAARQLPAWLIFDVGQKMKLLLRQGIDELRFGDSEQRAVAVFGSPDKERSHPKDGGRFLDFTGKNLTLGFDAHGRLNFIVALRGDADLELWGDRPFAIIAGAANEVSAARSGIIAHGRRPLGHHDSFGGTFEIAEERVTFCFTVGDDEKLEGIQIDPRSPSMTKKPNKAPEPTTFAVTSRAIVRFSEGRARTDRHIAARAAPAKVVAHL